MLLHRIRLLLLLGWSACVILVLAAYAVAYFGPPVRPSATSVITSLGTLIGLLAPHLTLVYDFFLSGYKKTTKLVETPLAYTLLGMCFLYWTIFIALVWTGVVSRELSNAPDGRGLETTTSVVIAVAGLLSFLAIKPTIKLFGLNK